MPNHCYQSVYLAGNPKDIDRLYKAVKEERFLDEVIPQPTNLFHGALSTEDRKRCEAKGIPNWYDWRNENWFTKWDICAAEICDEPTIEGEVKIFSFRCWTAWAPPIPVWDKLQEMGVKVHATYQDEGSMFEGEYIDGEDKCWQPEFEEEEEEAC